MLEALVCHPSLSLPAQGLPAAAQINPAAKPTVPSVSWGAEADRWGCGCVLGDRPPKRTPDPTPWSVYAVTTAGDCEPWWAPAWLDLPRKGAELRGGPGPGWLPFCSLLPSLWGPGAMWLQHRMTGPGLPPLSCPKRPPQPYLVLPCSEPQARLPQRWGPCGLPHCCRPCPGPQGPEAAPGRP